MVNKKITVLLIITIIVLFLQMNTYAELQPYLMQFVRNIHHKDYQKIVNNRIIFAETTWEGDVYFYKADISKEQWEDVYRHEIGHLAYWKSGRDPYQNSEKLAETFKEMSKKTNSLRELMLKMGYWNIFDFIGGC